MQQVTLSTMQTSGSEFARLVEDGGRGGVGGQSSITGINRGRPYK